MGRDSQQYLLPRNEKESVCAFLTGWLHLVTTPVQSMNSSFQQGLAKLSVVSLDSILQIICRNMVEKCGIFEVVFEPSMALSSLLQQFFNPCILVHISK